MQRTGRWEVLVSHDWGGRRQGRDGGAAHGGLPARPGGDVEERGRG